MPVRRPLASMMRPKKLDEFFGQEHIINRLRKAIEEDNLSSMLFYGPAGTGKTTLANIIGSMSDIEVVSLNATSATVSAVRKVGESAKKNGTIILFVDEVHRWAKNQQDVLLPYVEDGHLILIGATTENPYLNLQSALVSRCTVYEFESLSIRDLLEIFSSGLDSIRSSGRDLSFDDDAVLHIVHMACGDGRKVLTILESLANFTEGLGDNIDLDTAKVVCPFKYVIHNKDMKYDLASAFQGSIQASDADSAIYWLAKWLESGEDPRYIARRLMVSAAEDAFSNPICTAVAHAAYVSAKEIGRPECDIIMAQAVILIAESRRDKTACVAVHSAVNAIRKGLDVVVPKMMRDCHYRGAGELGHGAYADGSNQDAYVGVDMRFVDHERWDNEQDS